MTKFNGSDTGSKKKLQRIVWLKNRHKQLDDEILDVQNRSYLSADDEMSIAEKKKQKLVFKQELEQLAANG